MILIGWEAGALQLLGHGGKGRVKGLGSWGRGKASGYRNVSWGWLGWKKPSKSWASVAEAWTWIG